MTAQPQLVAGVFESRGIAEDACKRLRTEGVPEREICLRVLRETGPVPSTMQPELAALEVDPMVWGDVQHTFARFVRNGETVLLVRAASEAEVVLAVHTMRQYAPLDVEVLDLRDEAARPRA